MATMPQGDWREGQEENVSEIRDCYCPNCGKSNAVTMMLPTRIPLFREIIVMSLTCQVRDGCFSGLVAVTISWHMLWSLTSFTPTHNQQDCNFRNSEVTFGGEIQEKGERIEFQMTYQQDLDRQVAKSDSSVSEHTLPRN